MITIYEILNDRKSSTRIHAYDQFWNFGKEAKSNFPYLRTKPAKLWFWEY